MFETGAPPFRRRLIAAEKVQRAGYPLRIRLDPIVPLDGWQEGYANTVKNIFDVIQPERITLGTLRFEPEFYNHRNTIFRPDSKLPEILDGMSPMFESKVMADGKMRVSNYSYPEERRIEIYNFIIEEIRKHSDCRIALCKESEKVWDSTGLIISNLLQRFTIARHCRSVFILISVIDLEYRPDQSISLKRNGATEKRNISQTLSKYILEDKMIVFERYDGSGKLISRVPLNGPMLRVKA
jgi:hypothetical protein